MNNRRRHISTIFFILLSSLTLVPVASAHGGYVTVNGIRLAQWHGLIPLLMGIGVVAGSRYLPRISRSVTSQHALYGIFAGLSLAIIGAIWLVQLSPIEWYAAQPVIPRSLHGPLMLFIGTVIMLGSVLVGQFRWRRKPRFAVLGILLGLWVGYPGLSSIGVYTENNPLGYLIVFVTVIVICYILWRDTRGTVRQLLVHRIARRFGIAVGLLSVLFFMFSSGMLYFLPDDGVGVSLSEPIVDVLPVADPLVMWPAIEFWYPRLPLGGVISVGTALLVVLFGVLIGLNAALFAFQSRSGASQTGASIAGIAAPQACCCCGPALSQIAVVTLGPSAAAPIYLLFADPSSSIGSLFFVASVAILTGTLVRAAQKTPHSGSDPRTAPTRLTS